MVARYNDGDPAKDTDSNLFNFHYEGKGPGSNPGGLHQFAALANVVIAGAWRASERGSIPRGGTSLRMLTAKIYTLDF